MIIHDDIFKWPGSASAEVFGKENTWTNKCRIRIIKFDKTDGVYLIKKYYIIASDLGAGSGTSITNAADKLISMICTKFNIDVDEMGGFAQRSEIRITTFCCS